ncbi:MAG: Rv3654c family TadE-like protein [Actinomycetota bacterium]
MSPPRVAAPRGGSERERGSISVVAAGVMVVIVVLALASADLARVMSVAAKAQSAADAAALAAAQELVVPTSGTSPEGSAAEYAGRNGAALVSCDCEAGAQEAVVVVSVAVGRLLLFGSGREVTARARAVVDRDGSYARCSTRCVRPSSTPSSPKQ